MAKFVEHERALQLRQRGLSYSQIKEQISVSKSTLSYWLREYPLSRERINELRAWNERRIERFRATMRQKRETRLASVYSQQKKRILPLTDNELFLAGLFLYAGEGAKTRFGDVAIANTNPAIIKFFIYWVTHFFEVPKRKLKIRLHLYRDMDIKKEHQYWQRLSGLSAEHFNKPYIKSTSSTRINYKGSFGHGTCNVKIHSVPLFEKISMGIKVVLDSIVGQ